MPANFYPGQTDYLRKLNELARAQDIVDIPLNVAAAAASAAVAEQASTDARSDAASATASVASAVATFASFDARYLGAKDIAPGRDNHGAALLDGAVYWDTVLNGGCLRVFQSGAWVTVPVNVASQTRSTPVGGIVAANVQAALAELDEKKATRATTLAGYGITDALPGSYMPAWSDIAGRPSFAAVATSGNKADVGLGSVDNTSDTNKPVSAAQAAALALKAPLANPVFSGTVQAGIGVLFGPGHGLYSPVAGALVMITNSVERFRVTAAGDMTFTNLQSLKALTPSFILEAPSTATITSKSGEGYGTFLASSGNTLPAIVDFANAASGTSGRILCVNGPDASLLWQVNKRGVLSDVIGVNGNYLYPIADSVTGLGAPSNRFAVVYASTGAINTSDARLKTAISPMTEREIAAALDIAESLGTYQWLEAVQSKGADARKHIGATVQGIVSIMEAHGLEPFEYGFICYDSWGEEYGHRPPVDGKGGGDVKLREAGEVYSLRNDQLNMFIARGLRASMARTEARLAALEAI